MLPPALAALGAYRQFILCRFVPSTSRPGKTDKFPCAPSGVIANAHDPANWLDQASAYMLASMFGADYGVGFVLTRNDPFFCLDIDGCLQSNNTWSPIALEICAILPGAAEVSNSGTGMHKWGRYSDTLPSFSCKNTSFGLELYTEGRFIALGTGAIGDASLDATSQLASIIGKYFAPTATSVAVDAEWTTAPRSDWAGPSDDDELIRRMLAAKPSTASVFGGKATLAQLWAADAVALAKSYPDPNGTVGYGASEADAALAQHLAFWTGCDCERIQRLMKRSALNRDKYDREDYLPRTIRKAVAIASEVYKERAADTSIAPASIIQNARLANGHAFVSPEEQLQLWAGCVYVTASNTILTATGHSLGPEQFKNKYGGSVFIMTNDNSKTTTNAWEAFTHSQAARFPKVDSDSFQPAREPGEMWERDSESFVNSYRKLNVPRKQGDASPFLDHLAKVLPNERDRTILLSYMAAVVQYQGTKFQWAPMIQGVEGNGKTLFSWCVQAAVGTRYTHMPRASELTEKYNDWIVNKIFIGVEDVWYPEGRNEILETLKPMITNSRLPIRAMRTSERTMDVCANFIVNSNHKDAIKKTENDRRWCMLFCAQQRIEDLRRDGMTGDYFEKLYEWLRGDGYAIVAELLYTYVIPAEFGLSCLLSRAPRTSSTDEAVRAGLGRVEQEILETIDQGVEGFRGGWVSSLALDDLLVRLRLDKSLPRSKRRETMRSLGYDWHPHLREGRSTTSMPFGGAHSGGRPVIFIKVAHWAIDLKEGNAIFKAFSHAQLTGASGEIGAVINEKGATK
jgi:hypothetical protein